VEERGQLASVDRSLPPRQHSHSKRNTPVSRYHFFSTEKRQTKDETNYSPTTPSVASVHARTYAHDRFYTHERGTSAVYLTDNYLKMYCTSQNVLKNENKQRKTVWFQAPATKQKRTMLFWAITPRVVVILYWNFGTTYRCRNVGNKLPLLAAQ